MLKNNNEAAITKMARNSFRSSRRRNLTVLMAIICSSFLLFTIFTVGITYFDMQRVQNIRMHGADYDAYLYGVTKEQQRVCQEDPDILKTGIEAIAGYVIETEKDNTPNASLFWMDETGWNEMCAPGREWMEGTYPQKADEVMIKRESRKACGLEGLQTGDTFTMTYATKKGEFTKTFKISGMWDGCANNDVIYVSEEFYRQSGQELSSTASGRCMIDLKPRFMSQARQDALTKSMNLGKKQNLFFTMQYQTSLYIFVGILGLTGVICLCAYLLIYNIMYLSVSGNIRYYGLLQTVGMTGKQVCRLVQRQMTFLAAAGIAAGLFLGSLVSFFLIPTIVKSLGIYLGKSDKILITFHPGVILLAVFLTGLTVFLAGRKPAKMAVMVSPVEALGHRPPSSRKQSRKLKKGNILWRLAAAQLLKDKKKTGIVMISLALGLSLFLCLVTMLESQAARTIVSNYMDMDMVIKNDTLKKEDSKDRKQLLDQSFLAKIQGNESIKEMHSLLCTEITVPWEPDFSDLWMREFYDMWMESSYEDDKKEYQEHPENFGSFLVGIDRIEFSYLNASLEHPVDETSFLKGKTCILYRNGLDFTHKDLQGKKITCAAYEDSSNTRSFTIAGLTDESYYTGALIGLPPTVIVSEHALHEFTESPLVYKTSIRYQKEYDEETESQLTAMIEQNPYADDFSYESKIKEKESIEKAQGHMIEIGLGMVFILAFIGILNYVNTIVGNIRSREVEISVMESIGMTGTQVKKMLITEGLLFAGGSLFLTASAGTAVTYFLYQSMNYRDIPFKIPLLPMLGATAAILLVCTVIPVVSYGKLEKRGAVVERIRGFE